MNRIAEIFLRVSLPSDALSVHAMRSRPDWLKKTSQVGCTN